MWDGNMGMYEDQHLVCACFYSSLAIDTSAAIAEWVLLPATRHAQKASIVTVCVSRPFVWTYMHHGSLYPTTYLLPLVL